MSVIVRSESDGEHSQMTDLSTRTTPQEESGVIETHLTREQRDRLIDEQFIASLERHFEGSDATREEQLIALEAARAELLDQMALLEQLQKMRHRRLIFVRTLVVTVVLAAVGTLTYGVVTDQLARSVTMTVSFILGVLVGGVIAGLVTGVWYFFYKRLIQRR